MSLLVVGSVAYDSVQTPFGGRDDVLGGSATFFGVSASLLAPLSVVAVVGEDFRNEDVRLLESHGIDLSGLERAPGRTFRWGGAYHPDMQGRDTLFTELNVFETFEPRLSPAHRAASLVFLANIHPSLQHSVLEQVECPHFVAADTMNFWIDGAKDELCRVLERVDALLLNDEEARMLTGIRGATAAAHAIQEMGPSLVVIKRGEHGALMVHGDDLFYVPAFPVETVIDPTGAGDSFAGGFMGHLASTGDFTPANMRRAAVVGTVMASFCVEGFSVERLQTLDAEAVNQRCQALAELVAFDVPTL